MKIRACSWVLAAAYLICGLFFADIVAKLKDIYLGYHIEFPFPINIVIAAGPIAPLCATVAGAAAIILNDRTLRFRFLNLVLMLLLCFSIWGIFHTLFLPLGQISIH